MLHKPEEFIQLSVQSSRELRNVFQQLRKDSPVALSNSIIQFQDFIQKEVYFDEIIESLVVILESLITIGQQNDRIIFLDIIFFVMKALKRDLVKYTNILFPPLFSYTHIPERDVSLHAIKILDNFLSTPEKKSNLIIK